MLLLLLLFLIATTAFIIVYAKNGCYTIDEWVEIAGIIGYQARNITAVALGHLYVKGKVKRISQRNGNLYYPCNGTTEKDVIEFIREVAEKNKDRCDVRAV